ncbi:MAG: hypothetical protein AB1765_12420, partial [Candidatus Hydrogenedentota bacterium]
SEPSVINGPVECFIRKIQKLFRIHILLKIEPRQYEDVIKQIEEALTKKSKRPTDIKVDIDIDPISFL